MPYRLEINHGQCTGCRSCSIACRNRYPEGMGLYRRVEPAAEPGGGQMPGYYNHGCVQCREPACLKVCPAAAITRNKAVGVTVIDKARCIGCGACVRACPEHAPVVFQGKAGKCQLCGTAAEKKGQTACCAACPLRLIRLVYEDA